MYETTLLETMATRQQRAVMPAKVTSNIYQINETRDSFRDPRWRRILQVCSPPPPPPAEGLDGSASARLPPHRVQVGGPPACPLSPDGTSSCRAGCKLCLCQAPHLTLSLVCCPLVQLPYSPAGPQRPVSSPGLMIHIPSPHSVGNDSK